MQRVICFTAILLAGFSLLYWNTSAAQAEGLSEENKQCVRTATEQFLQKEGMLHREAIDHIKEKSRGTSRDICVSGQPPKPGDENWHEIEIFYENIADGVFKEVMENCCHLLSDNELVNNVYTNIFRQSRLHFPVVCP